MYSKISAAVRERAIGKTWKCSGIAQHQGAVFQLETAMGSAIECFDSAGGGASYTPSLYGVVVRQ